MEVINNTLEEFENAENYEKEKHKSHKIPLFKKKTTTITILVHFLASLEFSVYQLYT